MNCKPSIQNNRNMKRIVYTLFMIAIIAAACKKENNIKITPLSSVNVTNAIFNSSPVIVNTTDGSIPFSNSPTHIAYQSYGQYSMIAGAATVSVTYASDTLKPIITQKVNAANGSYYSMFLSGTAGAVDIVLVKDNYTNYADGVCGVRFINLSSDSHPISINITGNSNGNEVSNLAYKAYTNFKKYAVTASNNSFSYDIRDAATGNFLTTFVLYAPTFQNVTLALTGLENDPNGVAIEQINNY